MSEPLLMDVDEAARMMGIGRSLLYRRLLSGEIRSVKVGRRRLVPKAAIKAYVDQLQAEQTGQ